MRAGNLVRSSRAQCMTRSVVGGMFTHFQLSLAPQLCFHFAIQARVGNTVDAE
jgi:hypothetical protein